MYSWRDERRKNQQNLSLPKYFLSKLERKLKWKHEIIFLYRWRPKYPCEMYTWVWSFSLFPFFFFFFSFGFILISSLIWFLSFSNTYQSWFFFCSSDLFIFIQYGPDKKFIQPHFLSFHFSSQSNNKIFSIPLLFHHSTKHK